MAPRPVFACVVHALEVPAVSFCVGTVGQKIDVVCEAYRARPERWVLAYFEEVGIVEEVQDW